MSQPGEPLFGITASNEGRVVIFAGGIPARGGWPDRRRDRRERGAPDQDHEVAAAGVAAFVPGGESGR